MGKRTRRGALDEQRARRHLLGDACGRPNKDGDWIEEVSLSGFGLKRFEGAREVFVTRDAEGWEYEHEVRGPFSTNPHPAYSDNESELVAYAHLVLAAFELPRPASPGYFWYEWDKADGAGNPRLAWGAALPSNWPFRSEQAMADAEALASRWLEIDPAKLEPGERQQMAEARRQLERKRRGWTPTTYMTPLQLEHFLRQELGDQLEHGEASTAPGPHVWEVPLAAELLALHQEMSSERAERVRGGPGSTWFEFGASWGALVAEWRLWVIHGPDLMKRQAKNIRQSKAEGDYQKKRLWVSGAFDVVVRAALARRLSTSLHSGGPGSARSYLVHIKRDVSHRCVPCPECLCEGGTRANEDVPCEGCNGDGFYRIGERLSGLSDHWWVRHISAALRDIQKAEISTNELIEADRHLNDQVAALSRHELEPEQMVEAMRRAQERFHSSLP